MERRYASRFAMIAALLSLVGSGGSQGQSVDEVLETVGQECHGIADFPEGYGIPLDYKVGESGAVLTDGRPEWGVFVRTAYFDHNGDAYWMDGTTDTGRCRVFTEPVFVP